MAPDGSRGEGYRRQKGQRCRQGHEEANGHPEDSFRRRHDKGDPGKGGGAPQEARPEDQRDRRRQQQGGEESEGMKPTEQGGLEDERAGLSTE